MQGLDIVRKLGETLSSTATVKSVFGDPIHAEGRTVIPVARVIYGFGGGFGSGHGQPLRADEAGSAPEGEGGGGGGGALAYPAGPSVPT